MKYCSQLVSRTVNERTILSMHDFSQKAAFYSFSMHLQFQLRSTVGLTVPHCRCVCSLHSIPNMLISRFL